MTDQELKRLKRLDLLELLIAQSRENESLQQQLDEARKQLESRQINLDEAGSIAEAALRISGVFQAAQEAADQYLENVRERCERQEAAGAGPEQESQEKAEQLLAETRAQCQELVRKTVARCKEMATRVNEQLVAAGGQPEDVGELLRGLLEPQEGSQE